MTTANPASNRSEALFRVNGLITAWDPVQRRLEILERELWVTPGLSITGVVNGLQATASGHIPHPGARWIVTELATAGQVPPDDR
jgi:hypothetical protein